MEVHTVSSDLSQNTRPRTELLSRPQPRSTSLLPTRVIPGPPSTRWTNVPSVWMGLPLPRIVSSDKWKWEVSLCHWTREARSGDSDVGRTYRVLSRTQKRDGHPFLFSLREHKTLSESFSRRVDRIQFHQHFDK